MFPFYARKPELKKPSLPIVDKDISPKENLKPKYKIPYHFQKNSIITYSQSEIKKELKKYPGLLKTLGHAYQYQIIFVNEDQEKQYWFCRNLEMVMPLLKYLKEKNWSVDWQEKPFIVKDSSLNYSVRHQWY
ncbi:hypothetical protein [Geminocystis sp. NIES-3709]|uniref:hypothetical protein n=1 Tax=Geminocystis sp. NIES-3709 TaxID=1617448 RepID=UPI0005FCD8B4|nr:hypothetical protein [Geminocystis sp. NIES-3709]BAQ65172.1 hypothetical protein GM3709_1937 [Geminocystis sp. NIES-3709]